MRTRRIVWFGLAIACAAHDAQASYAQMRLDLAPLAIAIGAAAGALVGGAELLCARAGLQHRWLRPAMLGGGALIAGLIAFVLRAPSDARLLGGLVAYAELLIWAPLLSRWLPLRAWVRTILLLVPAAWLLASASVAPRYRGELDWLFGTGLVVWALLSYFAGDGGGRSRGSSARVLHEPGPAGVRSVLALDRAFAASDHLARACARAANVVLGHAGAPSRILIVFVAVYAIGGGCVFADVPLLGGVFLSSAGAVPGTPQAPVEAGPGAAAYWLTFGLVPSALLALLSWPLWRKPPAG